VTTIVAASLYWEDLATFGADAVYNQRDAEGSSISTVFH